LGGRIVGDTGGGAIDDGFAGVVWLLLGGGDGVVGGDRHGGCIGERVVVKVCGFDDNSIVDRKYANPKSACVTGARHRPLPSMPS